MNLQILLLTEWFIAPVQLVYFTFHKHIVKNKILQFVGICSNSNVSRKLFHCATMDSAIGCFKHVSVVTVQADLSAALLPSVLWLLYPWKFCARSRRQTWRNLSTIWKEKLYVFQLLHHRPGGSAASWHFCDILLFPVWRNPCVVNEVSFTTPMCKHFRWLLPGNSGPSMKEYGNWETGCVLCVELMEDQEELCWMSLI